MNSEKHSEKHNAELNSESHSEDETQKKFDYNLVLKYVKISLLNYAQRSSAMSSWGILALTFRLSTDLRFMF